MAERGRPAWVPTPEDYATVERLASKFYTQEQIAHALGIGESTFQDKLNVYPDLRVLLKKAQALRFEPVVDVLYERALSGDLPACFFILERKFGWTKEFKAQLVDATESDKAAKEAGKVALQKQFKSEL